jgi:phosphinothricin acetyltransferase
MTLNTGRSAYPAESISTLIVRDATPADFTAIQRIYAHYVLYALATFEEVPPSIDEMLCRHAAVSALGLPYLVAEADGQIAGYSYASPYRARSAYRFSVEDAIYVAPGSGGRGIGSRLLTELIARCEAGPWKQMIAVIGDSANAGSIAVHRRHGFQHTGVFTAVGFKFGRWVDTVLMQRPLDGKTK